MPQCAVVNCNNTHRKTKGGSVRYHRFPGDPATRLKWLKACGRYVQNWATSRICSRHFSDESYERDVQHELLGLPTRCRLKKGAIPEKNVPRVIFIKKEEPKFNESSIDVLLAVGLVPRKGGGLPQDLNKMHVMEDVREGSDVPGAQPSSPGHAEQRSDDVEDPQESNENSNESESKPKTVQTNGTNETESDANNIEEPKATNEEVEEKQIKIENTTESATEKDCELENSPLQEDAGSNSNDSNTEDAQYSKRKLENEETSSKRQRSDLEQNYIIRDKILSEYIDSAGCSSLQQIQTHTEQIIAEIRTLNELAKEKEKEWNNIIHLKKVKEELLLRIQRRKQIIILNNDKIEWNEHESSSEPLPDGLLGKTKQNLLKHKLTNSNSGLVIFSTSPQSSGRANDSEKLRQRNSLKQYPNAAVLELNGQLGDQKQKQRPVLDVQSIIADYRQRHPEAVPRRGRRIRSLLNPSGSGSQVKHNLNAAGIEANSELGLLLSSVEGKSGKSDGTLDTSSFKDVLMQFAKLSQNERQDLLQTAMKPPPYSEVTVHPVTTHAQSSSNSLLHGILTKTQTRSDNSKSTFSPTLARLLTAPERAAAAAAGPQVNSAGAPVSISEMLSHNKARSEITITPVGSQFELNIKEKTATEEEEAEDSADRLVIDESDTLNDRNRMDNGSDAGDEVPQCQGCNLKPAQFVCAGCGNQWYCSRECQVVAWDEHSEVCSG